jgi:hypothetical protein
MQENEIGGTDNEVQAGELTKLKRLVDVLAEQRARIEAQKLQLSDLTKVETGLEEEIKLMMSAADLERFDGSNITVFLKEKTSVKVPREPEKKGAFFGYLREQELFDELATVNSQTLNSWYKQEIEVRRSKGLSEAIPGLDDVSSYLDINVRRK